LRHRLDWGHDLERSQAVVKPGESGPAARVVVISPCRNEERTLPQTIECMRAQTHPPVRWVLVDDGSTDASPDLLAEAEREVPWIRVVQREDRGFRKLGSGVIDAFYDGLSTVDVDYDFLAKMDVDLKFSPRYIECLLEHFSRDPLLGAASGKVYRREGGRLIEEFMIDEMVAGQFKFYRRETFERIGGFVREVMWDGIDFHRARMEGFKTASLEDPELRITHLRLMGSSDKNVYYGRLRWGRGQWFLGSSFSYLLASGVFRMREKPIVVGGLLIVAGYLLAAIRREPRYAFPGFREHLRAWQRRRLVGVIAETSRRPE